jgi:hypothetical protein
MPRTAPPRKPAGPPRDAEDGAARVRAALVRLFDRKDGHGADWGLLLESLYRAGFGMADDVLGDEERRKLMRRVLAGATERAVGGFADGSGPSKTEPAEAVSAPSITAIFKSNGPQPPR